MIQELLDERRELAIANERLRLELDELRERRSRSDPRVARLEGENRRLRAELAEARARADELAEAIERVSARLEKALAEPR